MTGQVTSEA